MREPAARPMASVSVIMMIVLVVAFALQCINDVYLRSMFEGQLALTPAAIAGGHVWQLLTFQFLHVDLIHLACNLMGIWFFGRFVENVVGKGRFLLAYFGSGIVGGVLQSTLMAFFPQHFGPFVFGASAGVSGVFAIFCRLEASTEIRWNFILPIRAEVLLWITAGVAFFFTVVPSGRGGPYAHAAHLGGILAGLAFVKLGLQHHFNTVPGVALIDWFKRRPRPSRPIIKVRFPKQPLRRPERAALAAEPGDTEFMAREVDPILEKISAHGIQSLTERERKILDAARSRMGKR